jgi:phage-related baseplate assembly protein
MTGVYSQVDLSQLLPPPVLEPLDFETIVQQMVDDLQARSPEFSALVESDPAMKLIQVFAYRELGMRNRVNAAAKAVTLALAVGADLDHIAARFGVARLVVLPADPDAIPPTAAVMESDVDFRQRIPLSLEGYTSAGSEGAYVFHALTASGQVKDVSAVSPDPGDVTVYILSRVGNGAADVDLVDKVTAALNDQHVRPMTDHLTVLSASITDYEVEAVLHILPGPDAQVVLAAAQAALDDFVRTQHRMGCDINLSGIYAALHQPGVHLVELVEPSANLEITSGEAAYCTDIRLSTQILSGV